MNYEYKLEMDNEHAERCNVSVWFSADSKMDFKGFISISSDNAIFSEDLAHLEEWVTMGKELWKPLLTL